MKNIISPVATFPHNITYYMYLLLIMISLYYKEIDTYYKVCNISQMLINEFSKNNTVKKCYSL